jgi:deoxyribonuclease-4
MFLVGAHVSTEGGVQNAPLNAKAIGARAFALFTKNQLQWKAPAFDAATIEAFKTNCASCGYEPGHILAHDGYLINLANPDTKKREWAYESFVNEMQRCEQLGLTMLNIHPGSSLGKVSDEQGLTYVADAVNRSLAATKGVTVVLEVTAGQGSSLGHRFEHIAFMIDKVDDKSRVGFCIDTCHTFAAGYDLATAAAYQKTMAEADRIIGLPYLRGMHLNDTKHTLGSRRDRHEFIGKGGLGLEAFRLVMNDHRLEGMPLILETPDEDGTMWPKEIKLLYSLVGKAPAKTPPGTKNTTNKRRGPA